MIKHLLFAFAIAFGANCVAQAPAGNCLFIDYEAFQDDGILRYVNCGNDDSFNTGSELTIATWIRINDSNWNQKICGKTNGAFNSGYVFAIDQGDVYGEIWNPNLNEIHDGFIPPVQLWYHLAITFEAGNVMRGYVNGEMVEEINVGGADIAANADDFIIGIAPWDLSNFQTFGEIDEMRVYSSALTEEEIKANLFRPLDGLDPTLVAYYNFNEEAGTTLGDLSANENDGSFVGLTGEDWAPSRAPLGDETMMSHSNVVGLWNGVTFADPRFVITENGLSMSMSGMDDLDYCVFGHDEGSGTQANNLPADAPANFMTTGRSWYNNEAGDIEATLTFNLVNASGGGDVLDQSQPANHYTLCFRPDTNSDWQFLAQADEVVGDVVVFEDYPMHDGYFCVGVGDAPATITIGIKDTESIEWGVYPNPASDQLVIDLGNITGGNILLNLNDASGKIVLHDMLTAGVQHTIDVSSIEAGTYVLRIESKLGVSTKSLVIR